MYDIVNQMDHVFSLESILIFFFNINVMFCPKFQIEPPQPIFEH